MLLMGQTWFRHGEIAKEATRELTDVISKKSINANENAFDFAALNFTGNTVKGGVAVAA